MKSLKSNCNPKHWVTIFNSNEIKTLLKNYENRITKYLFIEKYKNFSPVERIFFDLVDNRNLVIYVWDGIDEILKTDLERVVRTISELNAMGKIQWITGRRHLKDKLESHFRVFAMNLSFVNEMEQESYIKKRLSNNNDSDEKIQKALHLIEAIA